MEKTLTLAFILAISGCETARERARYDAMQAFNSRGREAVGLVNSGAITEAEAAERTHIAHSVLRSTFAANGMKLGLPNPYPMTRCKECGYFGFCDWAGSQYCSECTDNWPNKKYFAYAKKQGAAW